MNMRVDWPQDQSARFGEEENFPTMIRTPDRSTPSLLATLTTAPTRFSSDDHIVKRALQKSRFCAANVVCDAAVVRGTTLPVRAKDDAQGNAVEGTRKLNSKLACPCFTLTYDVRAVVPR